MKKHRLVFYSEKSQWLVLLNVVILQKLNFVEKNEFIIKEKRIKKKTHLYSSFVLSDHVSFVSTIPKTWNLESTTDVTTCLSQIVMNLIPNSQLSQNVCFFTTTENFSKEHMQQIISVHSFDWKLEKTVSNLQIQTSIQWNAVIPQPLFCGPECKIALTVFLFENPISLTILLLQTNFHIPMVVILTGFHSTCTKQPKVNQIKDGSNHNWLDHLFYLPETDLHTKQNKPVHIITW